jgi:two-component system, NtrC family, response regulator AtoC
MARFKLADFVVTLHPEKETLVKPFLLVLTNIQSSKARFTVKMVLEGAGHRVIEAAGNAQANALLSNGLDPDLVVYEASSVSASGAAQFHQFLNFAGGQRICLITKLSEQRLRREAAEFGIERTLTIPVTREDVEVVLESVIESMTTPESLTIPKSVTTIDTICAVEGRSSARAELSGVPRNSAHRVHIPEDMPPVPYVEELDGNSFFLAASPQMLEIQRQVKLLADIDVNVLVLGESGTGKEVIAQLIHKHSRRSREKFLKVNCAALPADLLESELFGHRQGAFTGAINDRAGKFEQANRGTLLLDEIGEIGVQMQAKLLHVLQDGQFSRLGAQETTKVDVRFVAATNVRMEDALLAKTFREDLYYRLSVFTIKVPPLRERREEIPYLIEEFIRRSPVELTKGFGSSLPSRLMDAALLCDWKGNLRELRNFVTRTIVMRDADAATRELEAKAATSGTADSQDRSIDAPAPCVGIRSIVRDVKARTEAKMIQSALETFGWNRRRAAQHLNMSYRALLYKIQQHHLRPWIAGDPKQPFEKVLSSRENAV